MPRREALKPAPPPEPTPREPASRKGLAVAVFVSILSLTGLLAATKIGDPDTMHYLASGRLMLERGLDYGCAFSHTSAECQFVYPQWLFHLVAYGVYLLGGWSGLVVFQVLTAVGIFGVILAHRGFRACHPLVTGAVVLLAVLVARERFSLRADHFALLPAVLLYVVLEAYGEGGGGAGSRRRLLLAAAGVQCLWANIHGSFPVGLMLAGAFLGESLLAAGFRRLGRGRGDRAEARWPSVGGALAMFAVVLASSLLNPFGLRSFLQPFRFVSAGKEIAPQLEFLSPFAPADFQQLTFSTYKLLLAVALLSVVLSIRRARPRDLLVLAPPLYLSVNGVRYLPLFAVFCAILLPPYVEDLRARLASRLRPGGRTIAAAVVSGLLLLAIGGIGYAAATDRLYRFDSISRRTGFGLSELVFPAAAADFVEENDLPGRMFNDYSIGTYLNWRLFPARQTFIDGHTYTPATLAYYTKVMSRGVSYETMAETYGVGYFFLSHRSAETRSLIASLRKSPAWALVYVDEMAMVFLRRVPGNQGLIDRHGVDLDRLAAGGPSPLANIRSAEDSYLGHTNLGLLFSGLGYDAKAEVELRQAVRERPDSFVTLTALGIQLGKRGDYGAALEALGRSVRARPGYAPTRFWLGITYLQQKRYPEGIGQLEKALAINPRTGLAHYRIAEAYEAMGNTSAARDHYGKELRLSPRHPGALRALERLGR